MFAVVLVIGLAFAKRELGAVGALLVKLSLVLACDDGSFGAVTPMTEFPKGSVGSVELLRERP